MTIGVGTGTTITLSPTTFDADVVSINVGGQTRESLDSSKLSTLVTREFIHGDVVDYGEITMEVQFDPADFALVKPWNEHLEQTVTITFPDATVWVGTAFISGFEHSIPLEEIMMATLTLKVNSILNSP